MFAIQGPRKASETGNPDSQNLSKGRIQEDEGISRMMSIVPSNPTAEAAGVPLPSSPTFQDNPGKFNSDNGLDSAELQRSDPGAPTAEVVEPAGRPSGEESQTWTSRLSSILPDAIMDRPSRQSTGIANTRTSRANSVAPGAYPESDSTEESLKQNQDESAEQSRPKIDQPLPDEKSVRPRKSVSIVLPSASTDAETEKESQKDGRRLSEKAGDSISPSRSQNEIDSDAKAKQDPNAGAVEENSTVSKPDEDAKTPAGQQAGQDVFSKLLQAPTQRDAPVQSRSSSIAASHNDTDRSDLSTLHERESLAPSDADNSSLMPLLGSSPGDARSGHFTESLEGDHPTPVTEGRTEKDGQTRKDATNSPLTVDNSSSLSVTNSPTSSVTDKPPKKKADKTPLGPVDNGEGPSNEAFSLPPPKIVVKKATSAEESSQSPSLVGPTTTPVQDGPTLPRRQTTFVALGDDVLNDERAIKLPIKGRKLYVRKVRYAVLRRPVLNAALGRQVGGTAKQALRKLANGELIVVEPPASL
ncbi:MAG: hypothetical protein Q9168_003342 [Polycauliona sp. 1 TL-2023]